MKTHNILLIAGACLFLSCNKFLDREPLSNITPEQYFNQESDLAAYTISYYSFPSHSGYSIGTFGYDNGTDNQAGVNPNSWWIKGQIRVPQGTDGYNFGNIRALNYFIDKIEGKIQRNEIVGNKDNINHYLGEAYFLRAYQYFDRLVNYGDYPIITKVLVDDKDLLIQSSKRSPRNEVARFILEDLDKAIGLLKSGSVENKNRISKDVAYLFKSRVALFEGTWLKYHKGTAFVPGGPSWPGAKLNASFSINIDSEINFFLDEAMKASKEIAERIKLVDNDHSKISGKEIFNNPYYKMFGDENLSSYSEVLLWRQFSKTLGVGHYSNAYIGSQGGASGYTRGLVDAFLMKDGLPIYASSLYQGDETLQNVKQDRDERLQLFLRIPGDYISSNIQVNSYPSIVGVQNQIRSVTGYVINKGLGNKEEQLSDKNLSTSASIIFRASEAYLNYIEASYERTGTLDGFAQKYWKELRARAGVSDNYNATISATDLSKENDWAVYSNGQMVNETLYNIRRERRCEFIAEGMRNSDLRRWRSMDQLRNYQIEGMNLWTSMYSNYSDLKTLPNNSPNISAQVLSNYIRPYQVTKDNNIYYDGITWTEAHYLSPLGFQNFLRASDGNVENSVMYQNPGWPIQANGIPN